MSTFNEAEHPRDRVGKFTDKPQSAPEVALDTDLAQMIAATPEQARSIEYSVMLLSATAGDELRFVRDVDGGSVYEWDDRGLGRPTKRVHFGNDGDVAAVEYLVTKPEGDQWHKHDFTGSDVQQLQAVIDRGRLQAAGITFLDDSSNDGGVYGNRALGARAKDVPSDVAEIAKRVRKDIARAIEFGALPKTENPPTVRVDKFAGGQAILVTIHDQPDSLALEPRWDDPRAMRPTAYAKRISENVEAILAQYNDTEVESRKDYHQTRFYAQVEIPNEHMQRWYAEQKAARAAKSARKGSR